MERGEEMNVLICDDQETSRQSVVGHLLAVGLESKTLIGPALLEALKTLFARVRACREHPESYEHEESAFDRADIVILDNNLTYLDIEDAPPLTAEAIAGYVRAFTRCGYIVSLNMNPDVDFDLRYLVGDFSTRADLAINADHLENRSLWTGNPQDARDRFCPWYWPRLNTAAARRKAQVEFLNTRLDDSVLDSFGFDDAGEDLLSLHARGALSPDAISEEGQPESLRRVTFRRVFLTKDRSLPFKDDRELLDKAAREGNDALHEMICRVIAADIDLWFRRDVLGPQEPLVDLPHLLTRFPFLVSGHADQLDRWNSVIDAPAPPFELDRKLYSEYLALAEFTLKEWVQSPAFWWSRLKANDQLNDYFRNSQNEEWADVVFCEDESKFHSRVSSDGTNPIEFSAEFESSWNRRYISDLKGISYAPRTRLAR
jgi:hypothetical protein